ncbi:hypothetical protein QQF54_01875 [Lelliottia sp. V106_10]|uniref:hypothetical protein n=1 Tax=Lelliottia wanjuensis TaxID=3050585 RepID=UPI00255036DD|nr:MULTISPECIES: hypothetical protein [unclassified Lelliottia]MDK9354894.1 hypothetical protein [Lelliottia sp. V106_16]MDK9372102.1 hypothetical protein [Lelliottia sp. V106_10]MDK9598738.1 hypothetical protein [Lelliottia sp. V106_5]
MITDSLRGTAFNTLTANDQISHATWTGNRHTPMRKERFTYDKNLNIIRRQTWVNEVLESEAHQQQQRGRVSTREYKAGGTAPTVSIRIPANPKKDTSSGWSTLTTSPGNTMLTAVWWRSWLIKAVTAPSSGATAGMRKAS